MPPDWLQNLVSDLTAALQSNDQLAPIGCHLCQVEEVWEVTLFVSRTELLGGEFDGEHLPGRFTLDVGRALIALDEIAQCWWQPLAAAPDDEVGPHLSIVGRHAGHEVWVRIAAEQPEPLESGRVANTLTGVIEQRW